LSETADLTDGYKARLSPDQLAWLMHGIGVISEVPSQFLPGSFEDYQPDGAGDR
jgi:hypothetical protein